MIPCSTKDPAVTFRIEASVFHVDGSAKIPQVQIPFDLFHNGLVTGIARPRPALYRNTTTSDREADDDLSQLRMIIFTMLTSASVSKMYRFLTLIIGFAVIRILSFDFEIGGGRIDEQEIDFEIEQICNRMEDGFLQDIRMFMEEVHRTIEILRIN